MRCRSSTWLLSVAVLAASPSAFAQPAPNAAAQSLFDGGRALMQAGRIPEACAAFENSQKLEPRSTTLLNLASCREKTNQLATARLLYAEAGRLARVEKADKLVDVALNHLRKLEPLVSKLTVVVPADHVVPGLELLRNGEKLEAGKPQLVDGGSYTITARAPGRVTWTVTATVKPEGDTVQVDVPRLVEPAVAVARPRVPPEAPPVAVAKPPVPAEAPAAARPPVTPPPPPPELAAVPPPVEQSQPGYTAPIIVGAGALALAGVGIYFEVHSHSTRDDAVRLNTAGDAAAKSRNDDASHQRITGEVFDVAAVAAAGVAVYLGLRVHRERETETVAITPVAGRALTGLAISGHW